MPRASSLMVLLSLLLLPGIVKSQIQFGIIWNPPEDSMQLVDQLTVLEHLHISHLQLKGEISDETLNILDNYDFTLFIDPPFSYVLIDGKNLSRPDLADSLSKIISKYQSYSKIGAIGLIKNSQTYKPKFAELFEPILHNLQAQSGKPLFISTPFPGDTVAGMADFGQFRIQSASELNATSLHKYSVFAFIPGQNEVFTPHDFRKMLNTLSAEKPNPILFLTDQWLAKRLVDYSKIADILHRYHHSATATFAIEAPEQSSDNAADWPVLILVFIFGSFSLHYHYNPVYRESLFRYFKTHTFFVADIENWHIRSTTPGLIILVQHALAGCIIGYILFVQVFSNDAWLALIYYLPFLTPLFETLPYIIIPGAIMLLTTELIIVVWLYITNQTIKYVNQALLLYSWPLQIGIIIAAITLLLNEMGYSPVVLLICLFLFLINWLGSYFMAVLDLSLFTVKRKVFFLSLSIGACVAVVSAIVIFVIKNNIIELFSLIIRLSL